MANRENDPMQPQRSGDRVKDVGDEPARGRADDEIRDMAEEQDDEFEDTEELDEEEDDNPE